MIIFSALLYYFYFRFIINNIVIFVTSQMYRDFIVKQTSDYPSQFKPKTLVGNWYEERCNPQKVENFHFYKERKDLNEAHKPTLTQVALPLFRITSNNLRVTGSIFNSTTPIRHSKQNTSILLCSKGQLCAIE